MYVLDTSALLAHYLAEEGADFVNALITHDKAYVAAVRWLEYRVRIKGEPEAKATVRLYEEAVKGTISITREIAARAFEIREVSSKRVPSVDALIAASASKLGYQLVHRDSHFRVIPARVLKQQMLPMKSGN